MITETSAVAFRQNLADLLNQVHFRGNSFVLNKDGKPIAAPVDASLFARIRSLQQRFDELSVRLAQGYEGVSEEEGLAWPRSTQPCRLRAPSSHNLVLVTGYWRQSVAGASASISGR